MTTAPGSPFPFSSSSSWETCRDTTPHSFLHRHFSVIRTWCCGVTEEIVMPPETRPQPASGRLQIRKMQSWGRKLSQLELHLALTFTSRLGKGCISEHHQQFLLTSKVCMRLRADGEKEPSLCLMALSGLATFETHRAIHYPTQKHSRAIGTNA